MKVVITGGAGLIGSHLTELYAGRADVVVLDNFRTGRRENLQGVKCCIVEADIRDEAAVRGAVEGAHVVFHLAALVSVPESMQRPLETEQINVRGLLGVLEACRTAGVPKLVFASSAAVYGAQPTSPKAETLPPDPQSPYALTKYDGEFWCAHYTSRGWVKTASLRLFNVYGPRQNPSSPYAAAVAAFASRARCHQPLIIHGDGSQTRDFIYVKDVARALAFCAEKEGLTGVYNVGSGVGTAILPLAQKILEMTGSRSRIEFADARPGDIRHSVADVSKLRAAGWSPDYSLEEGLRDLLHHRHN